MKPYYQRKKQLNLCSKNVSNLKMDGELYIPIDEFENEILLLLKKMEAHR